MQIITDESESVICNENIIIINEQYCNENTFTVKLIRHIKTLRGLQVHLQHLQQFFSCWVKDSRFSIRSITSNVGCKIVIHKYFTKIYNKNNDHTDKQGTKEDNFHYIICIIDSHFLTLVDCVVTLISLSTR